MNAGLMRKSLRETAALTAICGLALMGLEAALAWLFPVFWEEGAGQWFRMKFVRVFLNALLGTQADGTLGPTTIMAFAWVHPLVLVLLAAHLITFATRVPAGEIDRGTIDLLLSLPVSRTRVYVSEAAVWLGSGVLVICLALAGFSLSVRGAPVEFRPPPARLAVIAVNLFSLYAAVGGVTWLCSAMSDRRGRAVAVAFGVVFSSFLINFIAQLWPPAERMTFLSVLTYYRPMNILGTTGWPVRDLVVLFAVAAGCWAAGLVVFRKRDICTV